MTNNKENYVTAYLFNRNKTISEYIVIATKKFVINDETYVIKDNCTYKKEIGGKIRLVAYYSEGNPNPYDLRKISLNLGLSENELDDLIAGDMYNILIECQKVNKQKYVLSIACFCLVLNIAFLVISILGKVL